MIIKKLICKIVWHKFTKLKRKTFIVLPMSKTTNYKDICTRCWEIDEWFYTIF